MHVLEVKDLYCDEKTYGDEIISRRKAEIFILQIAVPSALWRRKQGDFYKFRVTFQFLMVWYTNS